MALASIVYQAANMGFKIGLDRAQPLKWTYKTHIRSRRSYEIALSAING